MNIIQELEREQMDAVLKTRTVPEFSAGDTVKVMSMIKRAGASEIAIAAEAERKTR